MKFSEYRIKVDEGKEDKILKAIEKARKKKEVFDIRDKVMLMDLPNKISRKIKKALDNKFRMLKEERIHSKDKRAILGFIHQPKDAKYKMQDGTIIKVVSAENGVTFVFDDKNYSLSMTIVDIVDAMGGYKFKSKPGRIDVIQKGKGE